MSSIRCLNRRLVLDFLVILFGISAWVEINGLWVELPLLVQKLPEGWKLGSYIVVLTQIANIGPLLYSLIKRIWPGKVSEKIVIHATLFVGTTSCLLLSFFWNKTVNIANEDYSLPLLTLTICLAIVDCTSSVLYLPFLAYYKGKYIKSYLIGEGISGLLPSIIALLQGVGGNPKCVNTTISVNDGTKVALMPSYPDPNFSVEIFFYVLFGIMIISWTAFVLMGILPAAKAEKVNEMSFQGSRKAIYSLTNKSSDSVNNNISCSKLTDAVLANSEDNLLGAGLINRKEFYVLLAIQGYACCLTNGALPSIQTFSTLPYGDVAHHLSITLSCIANPIACFVAMVFNCEDVTKILLITFSGTLCAGYIMATAILSPIPPMVGTSEGVATVVIVWISLVALLSYAKACVTGVLRQYDGHNALFLCGTVTQIGSAIGAVSMFGLVNYTKLFQAYNPCS